MEAAGLYDTTKLYSGTLPNDILGLLETFEQQNHSGTSALIVAQVFVDLVIGKELLYVDLPTK